MDRHIKLPRHPCSAREARSFVAATVAEYGVDADPDTVLLLTSELVSNAIEFGESDMVTVHVCKHGDALRVEVEDRNPVIPQQRSPQALDEHGRGLALVDRLANDWGAHVVRSASEMTKVVWFVVAPVTH